MCRHRCKESRIKRTHTKRKIDKVLTHKIFAIPIFIGIMLLVFFLSFDVIGAFLSDLLSRGIDSFTVLVANGLDSYGINPVVKSLIVDGVFAGVGSVLSFLPIVVVLFFFLSILEDSGYMARIAFVMDKLLRKIGLSGRSIVPMLIGFGCSVPAIMSARTLSSERDRKMTIMLTPFMSCSAKIPIYGAFAAAFFPKYRALVMMGIYLLGIIIGIIVALILKAVKFRGKPVPFVMELPQYHIPQVKTVLLHVWERLKGFIIKAGTILFLACVVMWFLGGFGFTDGGFGMVEDSADSLMAMIGGVIAPLFAPLGFGEWQPVAASISGFTAKEAIVSTMGVLANVSGDTEDAVNVAAGVASWFPTGIAAFSFLMFNLLDSPCLAAIATMAQQMQSRKWFWFAILFQNIFAYIVCLCVYQIGSFVTGGAFGVGTAIGFLFLIAILFMLFRPDPYKNQKVYSKRSVNA